MTIKKIKGNKESSKALDRLARRAGATQRLRQGAAAAEAKKEERKAHKECTELTKKSAVESGETFLDDLALATAKGGWLGASRERQQRGS